MSTDLLFTPPAPENPSNGFQHDNQIGSAGSVRSRKAGANRKASTGEPHNFLQTLNQVSREQQDRRPEVNAADKRSVNNPVADPEDQTDDGQSFLSASIDPNLPVIREPNAVKIEPDSDVTAIMNELGELGIIPGIGESGFGFDIAADVNFADSEQMAAIKNWIARLQQNPAALTADLKTVVERIQQAVSEALNGKSAMPHVGKAGQGIPSNMVTETPAGDRFLKEVNTAAMDRNAAGGGIGGVANTSAKVPEMVINGNQAGAETAAKASDNMVAVSNSENGRPVGDVTGSLITSTEGRSSGETAKAAGMGHPPESGNRPDTWVANSNNSGTSDSAKATNTPFMVSSHLTAGPENENAKLTGRSESLAENSGAADQGRPSPRSTPASDLNPALNRASDVRLHSTAGEEPVSRLFQETRPTGEGVNRMGVDLTDETTGKVVKSDAATGDNGLLNSSGQNAEKMLEGTAPVKDADASQGLSRNQTLDQIVRRAAIHLRNGQQEARIELKPDFLGHVRLQIISENHQVTVRIMAEHGFVKDMIENNLHQLKADLQQQGLEVDKVEVSVSQDSEEGANSREKLAQSKIKQGAANPRNEHHGADEHEQEPRPTPGSSDSNATIDYFA